MAPPLRDATQSERIEETKEGGSMTRLLRCGAIVAAFILASTAVARADDACWQLLYAAIERDAAAAGYPRLA